VPELRPHLIFCRSLPTLSPGPGRPLDRFVATPQGSQHHDFTLDFATRLTHSVLYLYRATSDSQRHQGSDDLALPSCPYKQSNPRSPLSFFPPTTTTTPLLYLPSKTSNTVSKVCTLPKLPHRQLLQASLNNKSRSQAPHCRQFSQHHCRQSPRSASSSKSLTSFQPPVCAAYHSHCPSLPCFHLHRHCPLPH
jgi:hypothetical protein